MKNSRCTYENTKRLEIINKSIPEKIRAMKPCKCSKIRNDNGIFRVYKYKAVKLPSGKWGTNQGYLIGKIIPSEGFVPNKRYLAELKAEHKETVVFPEGITDVAYGQYALASFLSEDIKDKLKMFFPLEKAMQIYCYCLILSVNGFLHMDQIDEFYLESFLSVLYKDYSFKLGYTAITNLLHDLGAKGEAVARFEQSLINSCSGSIAIDGHVIRSCSENNDLSEPGYKANSLKSTQVNVLIAYDVKNNVPIMYRTYRGSSIDKQSAKDFLISRSFKGIKFIVDRGFYSEPVIELMSKDDNCYIIPVPLNNKHFKRIKSNLEYSSGEFVYKAGKKNTARIVYYEEKIDDTTRIIVYKDIDENNSKRKSYKQLMDEGEADYTQDKYDKYCDWWGVYFLQTNTMENASEVYCDYKERWSIETYNNYIKNDADFNSLKIQDYYVQHGFDFIMLVTGLIHSRINEAVKSLKLSNISTFDILLKAGHMRMVKQDEKWQIHNTRTKDLSLLSKIGFTPENEYPETR